MALNKLCPECNTPNPINSKFCVKCGAPLEVSKKIPNLSEDFSFETENIEEELQENVPFIGDSVLEEENRLRPMSIACGLANTKAFNVLFQQRNKLKIKIQEGAPVEEQAMDGLRAFVFPNISRIDYSMKDLMDLYVNTPMKDESIFENYGLTSYSGQNKINFGFILFSAPNLKFDDQIRIKTNNGEIIVSDYVIPLISDISYNTAIKRKIPASLLMVDMDWENLKMKFLKDDQIKFALFAHDEESFRWEHPVSMKIEIEDFILSELIEFESEQPVGSKMVKTSRLAKIILVISNTTYNQVFDSDLKDVNIVIKFGGVHKEFIQPSALQIIEVEDGNAEYLLEDKELFWKLENSLVCGDKKKLVFSLDRDILDRIDSFEIKISGLYEENPQLFSFYIYITPMGFPVNLNKEKNFNPVWNPGNLLIDTEKDMVTPIYIPNEKVCRVEKYFKDFKPAFFQEVYVSKENLSKPVAKSNYVEILNASTEFIYQLQNRIREMSGIKFKPEEKEEVNE